MKNLPDFLRNATNVYRTPYYIVKQSIGILCQRKRYNVIFSFDTYYRRTPERDLEYNRFYSDREPRNGKRIPTAMFTRTYIN